MSFVSQDSTLEYGQTPFAEFSWRVHSLCKTVWPDNSEEVHIDYIKGGASNRVFGLSFLNDSNVDDHPALEEKLAPAIDGLKKEVLLPNLDDSTDDRGLCLREESLVVPIDLAKEDDPAFDKVSPPNSIASSESSEEKTPSPSSSVSSVDKGEPVYYLPPEPVGKHYVLRFPRFSDDSIADYVATVEYINHHTTLPVPNIFHYDLTPENPIGSPYSIQYRCPGIPLNLIYHKLTFRQQCDVSFEVGRVLSGMKTVESSVAGQIGRIKTEAGELRKMDMTLLSPETNQYWNDRREKEKGCSESDFSILHYGWNSRLNEYDPYDGKASTLKGLDAFSIISFQFSRFMIAEVFRDNIMLKGSPSFMPRVYSQLLAMAGEMNELWCLGYDRTMTLCHRDFEAHNLMATIKNDEYGTVKIEAVLDWDDAIFAPQFMSSLPPRWLWSNDDNSPDDEPSSYEDPTDEGYRMLKWRFEMAVGSKWIRYAYEPQWRLARKLFVLALKGFSWASDHETADAIIAEWEELRPVLLREKEERDREWERAKAKAKETEVEEVESEDGMEEDGIEEDEGQSGEIIEEGEDVDETVKSIVEEMVVEAERAVEEMAEKFLEEMVEEALKDLE